MNKQKEVKQIYKIYKKTIDLLNKHELSGSEASALISMLAVSVIEAVCTDEGIEQARETMDTIKSAVLSRLIAEGGFE